jgi:hypothetical protein
VDRARQRLRRVRGGQWIASSGFVAGLALFVGQLAADDSAFTALWKGCVAALAVMAVGGAFQSFWFGDRLEEAEAGGVRLKFGAARRALGELNRRVTSQMADVNRRLYDLEKTVFKDDRSDGDREE